MPVSRSPVPPVAIPALPVRFTNERPSGPAIDRAVALEDDVDAVRRGELARVREAIVLHRLDGAVEQPRHLARVRRDDHVDAVAARQPIGIAAEGVRARRHRAPAARRALEQAMDERRRARILAEARADGDDVGVEVEHAIERGEVDGAGRRFVERHRSCIPAPIDARIGRQIAASRP